MLHVVTLPHHSCEKRAYAQRRNKAPGLCLKMSGVGQRHKGEGLCVEAHLFYMYVNETEKGKNFTKS